MPRLLDLFCGAGGCSVGYHRAGFEVVGVDKRQQWEHPGCGLFPRSGFKFVRGDALQFCRDHGHEFDFIHASPPCQAYTQLSRVFKTAGVGAVDMIDETREVLDSTGKPWIIENVVGAPLRNPVLICGSAFGLKVRRHRLFECSLPIVGTECRHREQGKTIAVYGDHPQKPGDKTYRVNRAVDIEAGRQAMGIDWMQWKTLTQAIPPAYTEFIGKQLIAMLPEWHHNFHGKKRQPHFRSL